MRPLAFVTLSLFCLHLQAGVIPVLQVETPESPRFTFQARVRGEYRDNVFDFSDDQDSVTDDSWLLHRIRLGGPREHLDTLPGYSHFIVGSHLDDTRHSDDADFAYLMLTTNY
jgi:hypothetical protein